MSRKRIILFSAIGGTLVAALLVWLLVINKRYTGVINAMPNDVVCFFDVEDTHAFSDFLANDPAMQSLGELPLFGNLYKDLALYTAILNAHPDLKADLNANHLLAGSFATGKDDVDYLFLLDLDAAKRLKKGSLKPELDGKKPTISDHTFEKETIFELHYAELDIAFSYAVVNGIFIYSTTPVLVENAILQLKKGDPVSEQGGYSQVHSAMPDAKFSVYIHLPKTADYLSRFGSNESYGRIMQLGKFADWMGLTLAVKPGGIALNGYCSVTEGNTLLQYSGAFSADMHPAIPANAAVVYRVMTEQLTERMAAKMQDESVNRAFFDNWVPWMGDQLFVGISESLDPNYLRRSFVIIPAKDAQLGVSKVNKISARDSMDYRGLPILQIAGGDVIATLSGLQAPDSCYGTWLNNALVLSFDRQQLTQMIDAFGNNATLPLQADYAAFRAEVSASFNASVYVNLAACEQLIRGAVSDKHIDSLSQHFSLLRQFPRMEMQFTEFEKMYMVNGFISYATGAERPTGTLWSLQLDAPVESGPFTVLNEVTGQRNIVVQDTSHQMYMISANGDVVWKKQLTSPILSTIHEVDFYGNNKTQYLFNTAEAIHLVDVHGENVEGFPITLTTPMSNGVAVFMSARNDYRFFVACKNNNVYGYYKDGKPIAGWNPLRNTGNIQLPMLSFTSTKGQVIGYANSTQIELRNASGASVLKLPVEHPVTALLKADSAIYAMDTVGNIYVIDKLLQTKIFKAFKPNQFPSLIPVPVDSGMAMIMEDGGYIKLQSVDGKNRFIAEGDTSITATIAMHNNGEAFFGYVTDQNKIVLLDSNGRLRKGFPLTGTSASIIDDLTLSGDNILITVTHDRVTSYRIQ